MIPLHLHVSLNALGVSCLLRWMSLSLTSELCFLSLWSPDHDIDFASVQAFVTGYSPAYPTGDGCNNFKPSCRSYEPIRPEWSCSQSGWNETRESSCPNKPRHHEGWDYRPRTHRPDLDRGRRDSAVMPQSQVEGPSCDVFAEG